MDETQPPSARLGRFVAELTAAAIPDRARRLAERCFLDTVGVTLAGAGTGAGRRAIAFAEAGGEGTTTIPGVERRAPEGAALLATGTAGHGLDYDDVSWGMDGHPSVTLVAPALAVGEARDATGQQLLTAFVAGFETECYLASAISPGHYERGWHATGTFGVFGAAAVACKLLGADAASTQQALAIAASGAAGLKRNFGSMTKPLHVGGAVQTGVRAARLAIAGFSADPAAIGGERGFWALYAGPEGVDSPAPLAPDRWALLEEGVHVKSFPCCYFTHTSIANAIALAERHELSPADVEGIEVVASQGGLDALAHDDPATGLEAKFSLPYTVATGLVEGAVTLASFEPAALESPAVQRVRDRVRYRVDPALAYDAHESTMLVETATDDYRRTLSDPPGTHESPLDRATLHAKYDRCAGRALPEPMVAESRALLEELRELGSTRALLATLRPGPR